jgi:hypothetical protein
MPLRVPQGERVRIRKCGKVLRKIQWALNFLRQTTCEHLIIDFSEGSPEHEEEKGELIIAKVWRKKNGGSRQPHEPLLLWR